MIKNHPDVLNFHRMKQLRLSAELWSDIGTSSQLGTYTWEHVLFKNTLAVFSSTRPWETELLKLWRSRLWSEDEPLNLVVYSDELTPGNVLRVDNQQKSIVFYVTISEFPPDVTSQTMFWLPLGVFTSHTAKSIPGRFSHIARRLLRSLFLSEQVHRGFVMKIADQHLRFFSIWRSRCSTETPTERYGKRREPRANCRVWSV